MSGPKLSVVVIALNEERDLRACLESVKGLGAEIVLLDSGSTDKTKDIARAAGAQVFERPFDEYAAQKQAAVEKSAGEWVLSLDADERVTPELAEELKAVLARSDGPAAYSIPFRVHFMGKRLRFGGLGSERHVRLFKRSAGRFVGGALHEGVEVQGPVAEMSGAIAHYPYHDLGEYFAKFQVYTANAARKRRAQGRRFSPLDHLRPLWELFARLILRGGVLDGTPGLAWAGLCAFHTWIKYLRLRELEQEGTVPGDSSKEPL